MMTALHETRNIHAVTDENK